MTNEKISVSPPLKTRQVILMQKIEESRKLVIDADIELAFLNNLKEKINNGKIEFNDDIVKMLNDNIKLYTGNYNLYLEKLNFLKEMRELKRADKIANYIENNTPDKISIKV